MLSSASKKRKVVVDPLTPIRELFTFSPFGLCCRQCRTNASITMEERSIVEHVRKHRMDSRVSTIRSLLEGYKEKVVNVKALGSIDAFRSDDKSYVGFSCACGQMIYSRKDSALRHCTRTGCDASQLQKVDLIKLCCGRYVSQAQVISFFKEAPRITQQFDYQQARAILLPILPKKEKQDHTYTHMYVPLIAGCHGDNGFIEKIIADFFQFILPQANLRSRCLLPFMSKLKIGF
jgi:bacterioferritin-associated ferredoxin